MCTLRVFAALTRSALRVFTSQTRSKAVVGRELALRPPMFGREHRTGPGRAPGDCQLVRFPKACRFAGRTTECTVTRRELWACSRITQSTLAFSTCTTRSGGLPPACFGRLPRVDLEHDPNVGMLVFGPASNFRMPEPKPVPSFLGANIVRARASGTWPHDP